MTPREHDSKIVDIQLLRAFAILLVLAAHASISQSILMHFPAAVANPGWIGVELFFVVSGFVVARSLVRGDFGLRAFVIRRALRLLPLLLAFIVLCFLVTAFCTWLVPSAPPLYAPPFGLLGAQTWSILVWTFPTAEYRMSYVNMAVWSLMVEFRFYAGIVVAIGILKLLSVPAAHFQRALLVMAAIVYAIGLAARILVFFDVAMPFGDQITAKMYDFLALGAFLGLLPERQLDKVASHVKGHITWLLAAAVALTMLIGALHGPVPDDTRLLRSFGMIALAWLFALTVVGATQSTAHRRLGARMRVWGNRIGDRSYAIFLLHLPVFAVSWAIAQPLGMAGGYWLWPIFQIIASALMLVPLVEIVHRRIELPMIDLGKRLARWSETGTSGPSGLSLVPVRGRQSTLATPIIAAWQYRRFIATSIRSEFAHRFARSRLGAAWFILHPLAHAAIFAAVLSEVIRARLPGVDGGAAYPVYLLAGMAAWHLFSDILARSLTIFIDNANALKKLTFPRACLPAIVWGGTLINHALLLTAIAAVSMVLGHYPSPAWFALPIGVVLISMFAFGLGMMAGIFNVFSRDVGQVVGVLVQLWFWLTPVVYTAESVPQKLRWLVDMNPMYPLVRIYQDALLYHRWPDISLLLSPALLVTALVVLSCALLRRATSDLVDAL